MGVDEAGNDTAALGVDDGRIRRRLQPPVPAAGGTHPDHLAVADGDRRVLEDSERSLSLGGFAGDQLADVVHDQI